MREASLEDKSGAWFWLYCPLFPTPVDLCWLYFGYRLVILFVILLPHSCGVVEELYIYIFGVHGKVQAEGINL